MMILASFSIPHQTLAMIDVFIVPLSVTFSLVSERPSPLNTFFRNIYDVTAVSVTAFVILGEIRTNAATRLIVVM